MIGASGLVGGALVRVLERHGVPVTAAYRSRPVPGGPEVDVRDRVAVERACASVAPDVVFWAVVAPGGEAHALEVGGVTYVAEACARAGARLVYYSCSNIGNHLIARLRLRIAEDYASVFTVLGEEGILTRELAARMAELARFRSLIVHMYWRVDHARVFSEMAERIRALEEFQDRVRTFLAPR